jgi:hypothetical protein
MTARDHLQALRRRFIAKRSAAKRRARSLSGPYRQLAFAEVLAWRDAQIMVEEAMQNDRP